MLRNIQKMICFKNKRNKSKGYLILLVYAFFIYASAQSQQIPSLKVALTEERLNYVKEQTLNINDLGIQVSFSVQSEFFGNTNNLAKKINPASLQEITKIKKELCHCPEDLNRYIEIGKQFNRLYKPDSARLYLTTALSLCKEEQTKHPDNLNLKYTEANIYNQVGDYASCISLYENILKEKNKDTVSRLFLTIAYLGMADTAKFSKIIKENYTLFPTDIAFTFFYVVEKGYAAVFSNKTIDKNCKLRNFTDLHLLNKLPVEKKDSTKIKDAWHSLLIFNGYLKFVLLSADTSIVKDKTGFFKIGNEDELTHSINYFKARVKNKKNKNAFMAYKMISLAYFLTGDFTSCLENLQLSIDKFPKDKGDDGSSNTIEQYNNIAGTYFMMSDTLNTIKSIENKILNKPKIDEDPNDYVTLGNFYFKLKNEIKAIQSYQKALEINPYMVSAYIGLGLIEFKKEQYEKCMEFLNKAYAINPDEPKLYYISAAVNLINFKSAEAWQIYNVLHSYYPNDEYLTKILNEYYYP